MPLETSMVPAFRAVPAIWELFTNSRLHRHRETLGQKPCCSLSTAPTARCRRDHYCLGREEFSSVPPMVAVRTAREPFSNSRLRRRSAILGHTQFSTTLPADLTELTLAVESSSTRRAFSSGQHQTLSSC